MKIPTEQQIAHHTEQQIRRIVPLVAFIVTLVLFTHWLGYTIGSAVHSANDWLAQRWPSRPNTTTATEIPQKTENVENAAPPVLLIRQPLTTEAVLALHSQGLSQRAIARELGLSRSVVQRALARA